MFGLWFSKTFVVVRLFSDFTQEISSQGLGVVFDLGVEEQKKEMVGELIEFLTTGRKAVVPITGDTQLFAKGELGVGPSG